MPGCVREPSSQFLWCWKGWCSGLSTFSWRHLALWAVPRAVSPCATAGAFPWCDSCLSPCPSAQPHQQQGEPHALSGHQMGACRKVSMGTRGRKNLPTKFSAIMSGTGEQAGEWSPARQRPACDDMDKGRCSIFYTCLGTRRDSLSTLLFPSTVVNSLIMGFFLSHMPDILVWLLHSRLGQQWLCMQWRLIMAEGNPYSQAWGTEDGFGAQAMRSMADVPRGDCIPYKSHWEQG